MATRSPVATLLAMCLAALLLVGAMACGGDDDEAADSSDDDSRTSTATLGPTDAGDDDSEKATENDSGDATAPDDATVAYFEDIDDVASQLYVDLADIANGIDSATFSSDEEEIAANEEALQSFGQTIETALLQITRLEPPPETQEEHDAFVESLVNYAGVTSDVLDQFDAVETVEELDNLMNSTENGSSAAFRDYNDACVNVEDRGEDVIDGYDIYCPNDDQ